MGQKVNPEGFRVGVIKTWSSIWYASKDYSDKLHQDIKIRKMIRSSLVNAGISRINVLRSANKKLILEIFAARPGMVIGKKGTDIEKLKTKIAELTDCEVSINLKEIRKPELDAGLISQSIASQLEKRVSFRKACKKAIQSAMKLGAKGIKVSVSGRLGGAEIARTEWYREGRVPLHTLRADIEYSTAEAKTTYGIIGVKTWVYKGDVGIESPVEKNVLTEKLD